MTSPAHIDANRRNAILSTGPRSEAGKATVSRNAQTHGLASSSPVLAAEDKVAFDTLVESFTSEFNPQTGHEGFLVQQMVEARWRLNRIRGIETAAFDLMLGETDPDNPYARIAQALLNKSGDVLSKLERYAAAAERSYYKAHKELMASQKSRSQEQKLAQSRQQDALLEMVLRPPAYKTNPIPDDLDDEQLEMLTRPDTRLQSRLR